MAADAVRRDGICVVTGVLDDTFLDATRAALRCVQADIERDIGKARLQRAGELGVLRGMLKYHPHFFRFFELPELLAAVDDTVSPTAILHLQNGFILPSFAADTATPEVFQNSYHRDFPRHLNGYVASVNVFFAIDEFRVENGATWVVPGSHQQASIPDAAYCHAHAVPAICPAGSMIVFDSTLWHAAGRNVSGKERMAINHQFTRSFIKQQIDYVRTLDDADIRALPPRTQQLLGYYSRVVTSLDEYYQPEEKRLYKKGQG